MKTIISLPHSSMDIPEEFHYQFCRPLEDFKKHIDFEVDKICKIEGYNFIEAEVSRFVVDLNRERDDVKSDQGVIINKDWEGFQVLKRELTSEEIKKRIFYYDKFFLELKKIMHKNKGCFLIDCHSMDSKNPKDKSNRPDICLANNFGDTCPREITNIFKRNFEKKGYLVEENNPYSGKRAKIIRLANKYGLYSLELEFNKKIYMNEDTFEIYKEEVKKLTDILKTILFEIEAIKIKSKKQWATHT